MQDATPGFISRPSKMLTWGIFGFGLFFLFIAQLFLRDLFVEGWIQIDKLFLGLLVLGFSLLCFYFVSGMKTYFFYKDRFVAKTFWGAQDQPVFFKDIESWTEVYKENEGNKLTIYTGNNKVSFMAAYDPEYRRIRQKFAKRNIRDQQAEKSWYRQSTIYSFIGFSLIGVMLLVMSYVFSEIPKAISLSDLQEITNEVIQIEQKESSRKSRTRHWLEIELKGYPNFYFEMKNRSYDAANIDGVITNISTSDTVSVYILKSEYEMKISKTKTPDFWTKHLYRYGLKVCQLRHHSKNYLTLKDYNREVLNNFEKMDTNTVWFLFGIAFFGIAIHSYRKI